MISHDQDAARLRLAAAQRGDESAVEQVLVSHRAALHRHCYRMLGDIHDADDALQETMTRAWRQLPTFEPRAPLRAWLYRIATNVCLTQLDRRGRQRAVETPLDVSSAPLEGARLHVTPYAGPSPAAGAPATEDPSERLADEETLQLAFITAGQLLAPRQRAVLLLRDVLGFTAREVATMLETTVPAVHSALQRARATLERQRRRDRLARPHIPLSASVEKELAAEFARAWQDADIGGLVRLLADDALMTMPPEPLRVCGGRAIGSFLASGPLSDPARRFASHVTRLNGQPTIALYRDDSGSAFRPYGILTLSIDGEAIASVTRFAGPRLFERLDLPREPQPA